MVLTRSLLDKLVADFPDITFREHETFLWSPDKNAVFYDPVDPDAVALLLHELSHALLGHHDYRRDIQLLVMETEAWEKAQQLADTYEVTMSDETTQGHLDTYRDWLHARSRCPQCEAIGHQISPSGYRCLACHHQWTVNEARTCQLRRYSAKTTK